MRIDEIDFNKSWDLITNTHRTNYVKNDLHNRGLGQNGLMVYENSTDPSQIIFIINVDGFWEVHHTHLDLQTGAFTSGQKMLKNKKANIGLPSTANKLYLDRLNKGQRVRVTAPANLFKTYEKIIKHLIDDSDGKLVAGPIDYNHIGLDKKPCVSQTISPSGKSWITESMPVNHSH